MAWRFKTDEISWQFHPSRFLRSLEVCSESCGSIGSLLRAGALSPFRCWIRLISRSGTSRKRDAQKIFLELSALALGGGVQNIFRKISDTKRPIFLDFCFSFKNKFSLQKNEWSNCISRNRIQIATDVGSEMRVVFSHCSTPRTSKLLIVEQWEPLWHFASSCFWHSPDPGC